MIIGIYEVWIFPLDIIKIFVSQFDYILIVEIFETPLKLNT